jgi:hypothetical protein
MTSTNQGLIRQDRMGRLRFTKEQRDALLDAFESSGLSGTRFAAAHGVKYQTFATWVQKRKQPAAPSPPERPLPAALALALAEVEAFPAAPPEAGVELRLPGGIVVPVSRRDQVPLAVALILELARAGSC